MGDELVFAVREDKATPATPISLAEAGLREREHLQQWVLANPEVLGPDVLIITSEFDQWLSKSGSERDRLDVLGLGADGRLVVAELKRDAAPDTVEMQAIKYAAMASRFDLDTLADAYAEFQNKTTDEPTTSDEAAELLSAHTNDDLTSDTLRVPRIVLLAGAFPPNVTATCVWLTEMGLDITLLRVQAYRTSAETLVTVSQHYPPPDVEEFTVAPTRASRKQKPKITLPEIEWTQEDYTKAASVLANRTAVAALDLCADRPGEWVPFEEIVARSGRQKPQARGDTGALALQVRKYFGRRNGPIESQWAVGGEQQSYYRLTAGQASMWRKARQELPDPRSGPTGQPGDDGEAPTAVEAAGTANLAT